MKLFRELSEEEKVEFRAWARENYTPHSEIKGIWHPVVQEECVQMNREAELSFPKEVEDLMEGGDVESAIRTVLESDPFFEKKGGDEG